MPSAKPAPRPYQHFGSSVAAPYCRRHCMYLYYNCRMSTLTLRVLPEFDARLTKLSKRRNVSKSDIARAAIERYLRVEEFEESRSIAVPMAQAQGIFTDEDVFRRLGVDFEP